MLPLVREADRSWRAGWCTYPDGFDENPDIEVFCGGENEKRASAAACWRQGNLLHFGFEQSPIEMNEAGQSLLLNCVAYISRFTEDRPIAITPSVFAGPVAYPRGYLDRRLRDEGSVGDASWLVSADLFEKLDTMNADRIREWYAANRSFLHPGSDLKLDVDPDAQALAAPIDRVEFFEKAIALLSVGNESADRAGRLLVRYAPEEVLQMKNASDWKRWFDANRDYLFFSDQGDYRWYIDPLAKKRGIPSAKLRGPARATLP